MGVGGRRFRRGCRSCPLRSGIQPNGRCAFVRILLGDAVAFLPDQLSVGDDAPELPAQATADRIMSTPRTPVNVEPVVIIGVHAHSACPASSLSAGGGATSAVADCFRHGFPWRRNSRCMPACPI